MFRSDMSRAAGVLGVAVAGAVSLTVFAPELRAAGLLPRPAERPELVYSIVNLTESIAARQTCRLDLVAVRTRIEAQLSASGVEPVFSPIAEGPGVLLHEMSAEVTADTCRWTAAARLDGRATPPHRDSSVQFSGLDAVGREVETWLTAGRPARPAS